MLRSARTAAKGLAVKARGSDRRLSPQSQQHGRSLHVVQSALPASRAAIAGLDGKDLDDRQLRVNEARSKTDRRDRPPSY